MTSDALDVNYDPQEFDPVSKTVEHYRLESTSENDLYELILRGYRKKPASSDWIKDKETSVNRFEMTEDAILSIMAFRRSMISKTMLQGNISGPAKYKIFEDAVHSSMDDFDFMLMINGESWGLGIAECSIISRETEEYLRLAWSRTFDNLERGRDKANEHINLHGDLDSDKKQEGMFR